MKVGVIDYGVGNLGSVRSALEELRVAPILITDPAGVHDVDRLILPGVGNYADCARLLHEGGWTTAIRDTVLGYTRPLLGVCVGMQLLADIGMEGSTASNSEPAKGLGLIPGVVDHLSTIGCELRIPHVGWNSVSTTGNDIGLFTNIPENSDFYFVHSYVFLPTDPTAVIAVTDYGVPVTAAVRHKHIFGTQFHPEKSSRAGFRLLRNFIESV